MPQGLGSFASLKVLDLSRNEIESLTGLADAPVRAYPGLSARGYPGNNAPIVGVCPAIASVLAAGTVRIRAAVGLVRLRLA